MSHWSIRQDATTRLCLHGVFCHRCLYVDELEEAMFEGAALLDSREFMNMMRSVIKDFHLMAGRGLGLDVSINIYQVLNALISRSESIPIPHRIVALRVLCVHLNLSNQRVKDWVSMTTQMLEEDVFALPVRVVPEFLDEFVAGFVDVVGTVTGFLKDVGMDVS